jgi:hypothetical protein
MLLHKLQNKTNYAFVINSHRLVFKFRLTESNNLTPPFRFHILLKRYVVYPIARVPVSMHQSQQANLHSNTNAWYFLDTVIVITQSSGP